MIRRNLSEKSTTDMFKNYFLEKKPFLQTIGMLIAIGAIFLNMQSTHNDRTQLALMNLQVYWLVIMTISILALYVSIFKFVWKTEIRISDETEFNEFHYGIAGIAITMPVIFLVLLWKYVFSIYNFPAKYLLEVIKTVVNLGGVDLYISAILLLFNKQKFRNISDIRALAYSILLAVWLSLCEGFTSASLDSNLIGWKLCFYSRGYMNLSLWFLLHFIILTDPISWMMMKLSSDDEITINRYFIRSRYDKKDLKSKQS